MNNDTNFGEFEDFDDFDEITSSKSIERKDTSNNEVTENTASVSENVTKEESSNKNFEEFDWEEENLENSNNNLTEEEMFLNTKKMFSTPKEESNFEEFDASSEFDTIQEENFEENLEDEDFKKNTQEENVEDTIIMDSEKNQENESDELKISETNSHTNIEENSQQAMPETTSFSNFEEELQNAITSAKESSSFADFEEELQKITKNFSDSEEDFSNFELKLQESQTIFAEDKQEELNIPKTDDSFSEADFQETVHTTLQSTESQNNLQSNIEELKKSLFLAPEANQLEENNTEFDNFSSETEPVAETNSNEFDNFDSESEPVAETNSNEFDNFDSESEPVAENSSNEFDNFSPESEPVTENSSNEFDNFSSESEPVAETSSNEFDNFSPEPEPVAETSSNEFDNFSSESEPVAETSSNEFDNFSPESEPVAETSSNEFDNFSSESEPVAENSSNEFDNFSPESEPVVETSSNEFDNFSSESEPVAETSSNEFDNFESESEPVAETNSTEFDNFESESEPVAETSSNEFNNFSPKSEPVAETSSNEFDNFSSESEPVAETSSNEFDNFSPKSEPVAETSSNEFDNFSPESEPVAENNKTSEPESIENNENSQSSMNEKIETTEQKTSEVNQEEFESEEKTVVQTSTIDQLQEEFESEEKTVVQTSTIDELQENFKNNERILSEQPQEKPIIMEVNMEQNNIVRSFHWPGEKAVYYFYIWHCAEMDERKTEWTSGRFPYLAAEMPLPPKEKLDASFSSKDWGMRRLEYKKNIPLYFYYAEPFQPSFFEPARLNYLRTLYFSYFPAYFSKVSIPNSEKATESLITPMLDPSKIATIPFLDESKDMKPCRDWLKEKIKLLQTKNALQPKANEQNVAGLVTLQEILRFYLRSYGFLLWALNYFCNYDNHARLGFSSTGNQIYSNCFPLGKDLLDFLCVRNCLPMKRLENSKIGSMSIPYHQQETVPTFLGLGSFIGDSWTEEKEWKENDFIIFDNCPGESRQEKTAENFRLFHKLWKDIFFKEIDDLLAENKIHISVRRFSTNKDLPLSLADDKLDDKLDATKLYNNTLSLKPAENPKKTKYLKNYIPAELATEFYNCFHRPEVHAERNNIFVPEKVEDWNLVAYLTYDGDLSASTLDKKTLVDFFQPDALPVENPREVLPRGILPFVLRP